jgi:integrase
MAKVSEFMEDLRKKLIESKGVAESSAKAYLRNMFMLNDKQPFTTLAFLRKKEAILEKIKDYAPSTQKTIVASIVSVLSTVSDKPTYKGVYKFYYDEMMGKAKAESETKPNQKTAKQKEIWMSWKEICDIMEQYRNKMFEYAPKKTLTPTEYDHLLQTLILSLYVYTPPRRNQDYLNMEVVKKWTEKMETDRNYLVLSTKKFVFNKYKTAKKYGTQEIEIPEKLMEILEVYFKHHPMAKALKSKGEIEVPFLVSMDGVRITAVNAITRLLNKIFGKKIGSSALRHIFLSDKYGGMLMEQKEDSTAMAHSLNQQREYIKNEESQTVELPTILTG